MMGLFDRFKRKEPISEKKEERILLAMPMFNNNETYDLDKVVNYLEADWKLTVLDVSGNNQTATISIGAEIIVIASMPFQIPGSDIHSTAQYAYNWTSAEKDLEKHNAHVIVTIMSGKSSAVERFSILTKVLTSILSTSNCLGVYQGSQSLLIPRTQYLKSAKALKENSIPVDLWVYLGLRESENGNSAYTYGLTSFGKLELEIINSKLDLEELYNFLGNFCTYIIGSNVTLKSGETIGYSAEQKIRITESKGQFVAGQSLKLEM